MIISFHCRVWFLWTLILMSMFWCHFWSCPQIYVKVFPVDTVSFVFSIDWQCWVILEDLMILLWRLLQTQGSVMHYCDRYMVGVNVSWIPLDLKEPMTIVAMLDDNHMTEAANTSFFTIFYKLFSMSIKSSMRTTTPEWTAQIASTVVDKRKNSTLNRNVNHVIKTPMMYCL